MSLYGWVACPGTELKSASRPDNWGCASRSPWGGKVLHPRTLKTCAGPEPARTGEQSIGTQCSRRQTSETVCDAVLSECENTRPSNPRTQTSPRGESAPGSVSALSSWTDARKVLCWLVWDPELGEAPHPSWAPRSSGCKKPLSNSFGGTRSTAPFSSRQPISCLRAWAFRGDVRDCTTPLKRGGLRLNWRVYPRSITLSSQREIPGITFHALMNFAELWALGSRAALALSSFPPIVRKTA